MSMRRKPQGAAERQRRDPGPWWWAKIIISVLLMIWRTIMWLLAWHHEGR
jgi:hypothetical protein